MRIKYLVFTTALWCVAAQAQQTNVLLIIADDLGIDSLAAFNDQTTALPITPTIDNIQSNGISFNRFYAYSSCSPTRGSMMTGRYSFRTGVLSPNSGYHDLQLNDYTLPEALLDSGVISNRLAQIGKWHLGNVADAPNVEGGWPHFSGALGGGLGQSYYDWPKVVNGVSSNSTVYATTDNVNDAVGWIEDQGTNSWFCWLAFNAPHTPLHRPPNDLHHKSGSLNARGKYEAMVEAMDTEMARLLMNVDLSVTTVIFMGDNGTPGNVLQPPFAAGHGKGSIYDGGIRVPLLVYGAAISNGLEGTSYDGVIHSVDMYSTILDLFGVEASAIVPPELAFDSRSFADVLRGATYQRVPADIMALNALNDPQERAIVEGDYKFIDFGGGTQGFYNVGFDITEINSLLDGVLSPIEQAAYDSLTNKLETYINVPVLHSTYMDNDGKFNVEIGWFDNEGFTLYRTDNLVSNDWNMVASQEFENNGTAALILRDPAPPTSNAFYRVTTP